MKDFEEKEHAVEQAADHSIDVMNPTMDGTAHTEISFMRNENYSTEIIQGALSAYDLTKLVELRDQTDLSDFYSEGKTQILKMWQAEQALMVHTDLFSVKFQINMGKILNEIEKTFKKRSGYAQWIKDNFEDKHIRYFQQAKQLADMGDFAKRYASLGKNRLLALDHIRKVEKRRECEALFEEHPLPDTADDEGGEGLKRHIDAVITMHRLKNEGLRFVNFEQALLIAGFNKEAISVKTAEDLREWLSKQDESERMSLFDQYVQAGLTYPEDRPYMPGPSVTLNKIFADFLHMYGPHNLEDDFWIEQQRELIDVNSLRSVQSFINRLLERIVVDEVTDDTPTVSPQDSAQA